MTYYTTYNCPTCGNEWYAEDLQNLSGDSDAQLDAFFAQGCAAFDIACGSGAWLWQNN
jgi:hypothetical protein